MNVHHVIQCWCGWLVVLRINVDLAIFQPYLDLEAGDNQSLKIQVARPGIEPRSSCSASQELNHSATAAPMLVWRCVILHGTKSPIFPLVALFGNRLFTLDHLCVSNNKPSSLNFKREYWKDSKRMQDNNSDQNKTVVLVGRGQGKQPKGEILMIYDGWIKLSLKSLIYRLKWLAYFSKQQ